MTPWRDCMRPGNRVNETMRDGDLMNERANAGRRQFRIALTGDYEALAMDVVPWDELGADVEVVTFTEPFRSARETVAALRDFDAVTLMRERTPLTREILGQLPRLKFIVFSGKSNDTLDQKAAAERG